MSPDISRIGWLNIPAPPVGSNYVVSHHNKERARAVEAKIANPSTLSERIVIIRESAIRIVIREAVGGFSNSVVVRVYWARYVSP